MKPSRDAWEESARIVESYAADGGELMLQFLAHIADAIRKRGARNRARAGSLPHEISTQSGESDIDQDRTPAGNSLKDPQ